MIIVIVSWEITKDRFWDILQVQTMLAKLTRTFSRYQLGRINIRLVNAPSTSAVTAGCAKHLVISHDEEIMGKFFGRFFFAKQE